MCIGITGSTGILGRILKENLDVKSIKYNCFRGDIRSRKDIKEWLSTDKFNSLFHFASIVPVNEVNDDPIKAFETNVMGTYNLVQEITSRGLNTWFFCASTSHVYKSSMKPIKETSSIKPQNLYGQTKFLAENVINYFNQFNEVKFCVGRIFSFYHEYQKPPFLYPTIVDRLKIHDFSKPFEIRGGNNIRDITNAERIIDIIIRLFEKRYEGTINIGSGKGIKISDFIKSLIKQNITILNTETEKPSVLIADISKLKKVLNND